MGREPDYLAFMRGMAALPPSRGLSLAGIRRRYAGALAQVPRPPVAHVRDLIADGPAGPLRARLNRPAGDAPAPAIVFFHGGDWVMGDVEAYDPARPPGTTGCARRARRTPGGWQRRAYGPTSTAETASATATWAGGPSPAAPPRRSGTSEPSSGPPWRPDPGACAQDRGLSRRPRPRPYPGGLMPEGHTIHRLAGEHRRMFGGAPVHAQSPQGRFAAGALRIDGQLLLSAEAHGKHLLLEFGDDRWLHVHLGIYGAFTFGPPPAPAPTGAVRLRLSGPGGYADLRGPAACELMEPGDKKALHDRLGADPLRPDADPARARRRIGASRTPIAVLLMDQSVVAGPGNIYRAEVLYRQGIDPDLPGRNLTPDQWTAIWADLAALMTEGVRTGRIDTVRPEHTPEAMGRPPRKDDHGGEVYVYRRAGLPCLVCRTEVRTKPLAGRNLFWCPGCQPTAT
jgi:formamidopyrimidine-DNA glycosylase